MVDKMKFKSKMDNIAISNGMPLVSAEVQAYYDGWEHGRKALIKELKAEIEPDGAYYQEIGEKERASAYLEILSTIDKYAGGE